MQLTCPNCGARYRIDASDWPTEPAPEGEPAGDVLFRPRRARCKVCRAVWAATPEEEVLELEDPLPPDEEHPRLGDAAWASVGGWPDPKPLAPPAAPQPDFAPPAAPQPDFAPPLDRPPPIFTPPGFAPPKDPSAPIYAAPRRPVIHFDAPPEPLSPEPLPPEPLQAERPQIRSRLPGPGASG
ncbi:MAG: MJ0042-type zinc finger domain-containing protein, partial [Sandaracinobacteroides sp.]